MIYIYFLIYDDLLVMDNDDYCRGKLINYKVYGEWKVIFVGDVLLIKVFELVFNDIIIEDSVKVSIIKRFLKVSGYWGMVGG